MLDIYFIDHSRTHMPKDPRGLERAGAIDFDAHGSLAALFDACSQAGLNMRYFDDSLLSPAQVVRMLEMFIAKAGTLASHRGQAAAFKAMHDMLSRAADRGMGLAAFCD
jgi:hypothetical protein